MNANRAIVLTARATAAIAVIRITGAAIIPFLAKHFSGKLTPLHCVHGDLIDGERVIDDPVIVLHENCNTADINLHGGPWVVQSCLDFLARNGFAIVTDDLDLWDGDDLIEREMLASLHLAKTELALRALLAQPRAWRENPQVDMTDAALWWLLHPPTVAIVGAANVGKSTLANQLFAQERSITADAPGTTRDWVGEIANIDGLAVTLIDTPGFRKTTDEIERAAMVSARRRTRNAGLILLVLDVTRPLEEQRRLLSIYPRAICIGNKSDLAPAFDRRDFLQVSAKTGANVHQLRRRIASHFGVIEMDLSKPRCWTDRQFRELAGEILVGHKNKHAKDQR